MAPVRRIVVDVLKPHDPPMLEFTREVADVESVAGASTSLVELDQQVQNVKITLEGEALSVDAIEASIESLGGTVHSVDLVACGDRLVDDEETPQDG
jgi:hypothetical protein